MDDSLPSADSPDVPSSGRPHEVAGNSDGPGVAVTLTDSDFEPEPLSGRAPRKPGPGLPESVLWIVGLFVVQILGAIPFVVYVVAKTILSLGATETERLLQDPIQLQELLSNNMALIAGGSQLVFIVLAIVAGVVRLGKNRRQHLPLRAIPLQHCVMIGLLIFPLIMFGVQLSIVFQQVLDEIAQKVPVLKWLSEQESMNVIVDIVEQASLPFGLLIIAVIPAIAEEIVFRGIIGRGLVARWGMRWGVLLTSMLFAAIHVQPAQVFALLPMAVCMHVVYLSTRSFWAPMAIHFVNNASAVVIIKLFAGSEDLVDQSAREDPSWTVLMMSGCCVLALISLIWKTRVQYVHADGTVWDPGYQSADTPSPELSTVSVCTRTQTSSFVAAAVIIVLFVMIFIWYVIEDAVSAAGGF